MPPTTVHEPQTAEPERTVRGGVSRLGPAELLKRMPDAFRLAAEAGMTVSAWLEHEDPSDRYPHEPTDAFQRLLKEAGIRTHSVPEYGIYASPFTAFDQNAESRALAVEWAARTWRAYKMGRNPSTRSLFITSDDAVGSIPRPFADAVGVRMKQVQPRIPLSVLIAQETTITGTAYRAVYLDEPDEDEVRLKRVSEAAEISKAIIRLRDETVNLFKYGRALEWSYEAAREMPIDKVSLYIAKLVLQTENDKVAFVVDILVNGDGNPNTGAEVIAITSVDAAATNNVLTLRGYLGYKKKFPNPYALIAVLARDELILNLELLDTGSANILLFMIQSQGGFGRIRPMNVELADGVLYGDTEFAPANQYVGIDTRFALERVSQIGATVSEADRFITRQTDVITFTETEGWKIFDSNATKILDVTQ